MTYYCPFCKQKMIHQPQNRIETQDDTLKAEVGDTFRCGCSIKQIERDNIDFHFLNSWKLENKGWFYLGSMDGKHLTEYFRLHNRSDWVRIEKTSEPYNTLKEVVEFT